MRRLRTVFAGLIAMLLAVTLAGLVSTSAEAKAGPSRAEKHAATSGIAAKNKQGTATAPIHFHSKQGSFRGVFVPQHFSNDNGQMKVSGVVKGLVHKKGHRAQWVTKNVTTAVKSANGVGMSGGMAAAGCNVLNLNLAPLHLDLLGLNVDLNQVVLNITAVPGTGLLGDLLCSVANLLNGGPLGGLLTQVTGLLNQILGGLGL